jgi:hypothetical protein
MSYCSKNATVPGGGMKSKDLARLGLLMLASEKARAAAGAQDSTPLAASCGDALRHQQNDNLVSRIYRLSGNGTLPIPGGKFELGKCGRQFDDD